MKKHNNSFIAIIEAVKEYLGNRCYYCNSTKNLHIHHIIPLSKGGKNSLGNFEIVCRKCHKKIHYQIEKVLPKKYIPVEIYCEKCGKRFYKKINWGKAVCPECKRKERNLSSREKYSQSPKTSPEAPFC